MTDLEMTKFCAEAEGRTVGRLAKVVVSYPVSGCAVMASNARGGEDVYDPLHDDAQAMALVKQFHLSSGYNGGWGAVKNDERGMLLSGAYHHDCLNRAICVCVANMRQSVRSQDSTPAKCP